MRIDALAHGPTRGPTRGPTPQVGPAAAHAARGVAKRAVALLVTAGTGVQVPLGFPGVVRRRARPIGPQRLGRVETTATRQVANRSGHGHAGALMTREAERLLLATAGATRVVLTRRDSVQAQEVVRMNATWLDVAVMTTDAEALLVAIGAELTVVTGHELVALDEVGAVPGIVQPGWRQHLAARKAGRERAVRLTQVAGRAGARRFDDRRGSGHRLGCQRRLADGGRARAKLVTADALLHAWQLVARRQPELLDRAVAARARHALACDVLLVIEAQIGLGHEHGDGARPGESGAGQCQSDS